MAALPPEYRHEPSLALAAGDDGLDIVRRILAAAPDHLNPGGVLAIEVGHNRDIVDAAFPELPLIWLDTESAEGKVFMLRREDLLD
jgi:ribosomal protein L3 glutamine methyltransferase